jgi:hypothetical protein
MALTKVLITVKTYPTISTKYEELVCTAGFLEDGGWIRIYPVQYRKKSFDEQYRKYDWIEIDLVKNEKDVRPESYRPYSHESEIKIFGHIDTDGGSWYERRKVVRKLPYKFSYRFTDEQDQQATLMIEDWELGQLYWNSLARHEGNELKACTDVRKKYFDEFVTTKDLFLFLGTTREYHFMGPNPFIVIGTFYPKFPTKIKEDPQMKMF